MFEPSELDIAIANAVRANSILFLRRAANEIITHDDTEDGPFDRELGTVVAVFTQMSLELSLTSYLIRNNGVRSVIVSSDALTDEEIKDKWLSNELRTKRFEDNKRLFSENHRGLYSVFEGNMDDFQKTRNKIIHFGYEFTDSDLYELKYEATYVLIHTISRLLFDAEIDHSQNVSSLLPHDVFEKLIRFPPYLYYVEDLAKAFSSEVLKCPKCDHRTFSDHEYKCFACTYEEPFLDFIFCRECSVRSVMFDYLNIDINEKVPSLCLNCGHRTFVFDCKECGLRSSGEDVSDCEFCSGEQ